MLEEELGGPLANGVSGEAGLAPDDMGERAECLPRSGNEGGPRGAWWDRSSEDRKSVRGTPRRELRRHLPRSGNADDSRGVPPSSSRKPGGGVCLSIRHSLQHKANVVQARNERRVVTLPR